MGKKNVYVFLSQHRVIKIKEENKRQEMAFPSRKVVFFLIDFQIPLYPLSLSSPYLREISKAELTKAQRGQWLGHPGQREMGEAFRFSERFRGLCKELASSSPRHIHFSD